MPQPIVVTFGRYQNFLGLGLGDELRKVRFRCRCGSLADAVKVERHPHDRAEEVLVQLQTGHGCGFGEYGLAAAMAMTALRRQQLEQAIRRLDELALIERRRAKASQGYGTIAQRNADAHEKQAARLREELEREAPADPA